MERKMHEPAALGRKNVVFELILGDVSIPFDEFGWILHEFPYLCIIFGWDIFFPGRPKVLPWCRGQSIAQDAMWPLSISNDANVKTKNETWNNWFDYPVIWELLCFCLCFFPRLATRANIAPFCINCGWLGHMSCVPWRWSVSDSMGSKQHIVALKALTNAEFLKSQQV